MKIPVFPLGIRRAGGFVVPLVLCAILALGGLIASISSLQRGFRTQLAVTNNRQIAFLIASSAFSKVLAKVQAVPWSQRPCAGRPFIEMGVYFQDGSYDLFVQDTPGKEKQLDIYIRTRVAANVLMFFWRVQVNDDFLDVTNRFQISVFLASDPASFPTAGGPSGFSKYIDDLLQTRAANQDIADETAARLETLTNVKDVLSVLGARQPVPIEDSGWLDSKDAVKTPPSPISFPLVSPPENQEIPSQAGPGGPAIAPPDSPQGTSGRGKGPGRGGQGFPLPPAIDYAAEAQRLKDLADTSAKQAHLQGNLTGLQPPEAVKSAENAVKSATTALDAGMKLTTLAQEQMKNGSSKEVAKSYLEMAATVNVSTMESMGVLVSGAEAGIVNMVSNLGGKSSAEMFQEIDLAKTYLNDTQQVVTQLSAAVSSLAGLCASDPGNPILGDAAAKAAQVLSQAQADLQAIQEAVAKAEADALVQKAKEEAEAAAAAAAAAAASGDPAGGLPPMGQ